MKSYELSPDLIALVSLSEKKKKQKQKRKRHLMQIHREKAMERVFTRNQTLLTS